jgi:hypothetical protein
VVRQLGLLTMQQVPLVKTIFTRAAMGLDVPLSKVLAMPAAPTASSNSRQEKSL